MHAPLAIYKTLYSLTVAIKDNEYLTNKENKSKHSNLHRLETQTRRMAQVMLNVENCLQS